jgi:hypothetical protein
VIDFGVDIELIDLFLVFCFLPGVIDSGLDNDFDSEINIDFDSVFFRFLLVLSTILFSMLRGDNCLDGGDGVNKRIPVGVGFTLLDAFNFAESVSGVLFFIVDPVAGITGINLFGVL